jgi:hypothetical protein
MSRIPAEGGPATPMPRGKGCPLHAGAVSERREGTSLLNARQPGKLQAVLVGTLLMVTCAALAQAPQRDGDQEARRQMLLRSIL